MLPFGEARVRVKCVLWLLLFLSWTSSLFAVEVLTPALRTVVKKDALYLVFKGPVDSKVLVKKGVGAVFIRKDSLAGVYVFHYLLKLRRGENLFFIDPGGERLKIFYKHSSPVFYSYHRKGREKECLPCHNRDFVPSRCVACHRFEKDTAVYLHGPFYRKRCFSCHEREYQKGKRFFVLGSSDFDLCMRCHTAPLVWQDMLYQHGPFGARSCTPCHDPHQAKYRFLLKNEPRLEVCLVCHRKKAEDLVRSGYKVHPIVSAKGCTVCHDPHASDYPKQLYDKPYNVCVGCHPKFKGRKRGHPVVAHPIVGVYIPGTRKKLTCSSCHDPHGSVYDSLLYASKAGNRICIWCHKY